MGAPPSVYPRAIPRSFPVTACAYCGGTHQRAHCPNCGAPAPAIDEARNFRQQFYGAVGFADHYYAEPDPPHPFPDLLASRQGTASRATVPIHKYGYAYFRSFFDYLYPAPKGPPPQRPQDTVTL